MEMNTIFLGVRQVIPSGEDSTTRVANHIARVAHLALNWSAFVVKP